MNNNFNFPLNLKAMFILTVLIFGAANSAFASIDFSQRYTTEEMTSFNNSIIENEIRIGFGTALNSDLFNVSHINESTWNIVLDGEIIRKGKGLDLFKFQFERPGQYYVNFQEDLSVQHDHSGCNHYVLPEMLLVRVSPVRIEILCEEISFSNPIAGGVEITNTTMNIPVTVHTYSGKQEPVVIPIETSSYGILTTLVGKLVEPILVLSPGRYVFKYSLSGAATSGTYIGFDIIDNNGNVIPCGVTTMIK